MNQWPLESLALCRMASGHLYLKLTKNINWETFPNFATALLKSIGGKIDNKIESMDIRLWEVTLMGANLNVVFDDYPLMVSIESTDHAGDIVITRLHEQFKQKMGSGVRQVKARCL